MSNLILQRSVEYKKSIQLLINSDHKTEAQILNSES